MPVRVGTIPGIPLRRSGFTWIRLSAGVCGSSPWLVGIGGQAACRCRGFSRSTVGRRICWTASPPATIPEKKYPVASHLINFHSWRPYINDPDYTLSLASENILNTLESEVFVTYDRDEEYKQVGVDATYGAWYPWIDAGWNYTFGRNALYGTQKVFWNESECQCGL